MRLSDQAASFLYLETPATPMHNVCVSVIQGDVSLSQLTAHVAARLHRLPRYRQKLAFVPFNLGQPLWVDDADFALPEHLQVIGLEPGTSLDAALADAVQRTQSPLSRDKPLWLMQLVTGVPDTTLLVHTAHHAMLDGISINDVSQVLFDLQATPKVVLDIPSWQPQPAPGGLELASAALAEAAGSFAARTERLRNLSEENSELVRRATESVGRFVTEPVLQAPWNRGLVGVERQFRSREYSFADIRGLKRHYGGTVNDIVLAIVAEAAARYLALGEAPPADRHMRIMCPVGIRREDVDGARGNRLSGVFPVLDVEPMPAVDRLRKVRWEMELIRQNREAQALQLLTELVPPLPTLPTSGDGSMAGMFSAAALNFTTFNPRELFKQFAPSLFSTGFGQAGRTMAGFNFSCVNIPGAQTQQYIAGQAVAQHLFVPALAGNLGYATAVTTYAQTIVFNLVSDPQLLPDIDAMVARLDEVVAELLAGAQQPRSADAA